MSDNRKRFFKNGLILTAVGLAMRSVGMIFNSYVTKTVGAEGIGIYTLIMTVYAFAVTFATSGINLTVTRLVAAAIGEGREDSVRRILRHAVLYSLVFSAAATAVLFVFADYFGSRVLGDARTVLPLRVLSFSLVPLALSSVFSGYFVGVKRVSRNATVQVLGQIFRIGITMLAVGSFAEYGVEYATLALCFSATLTELLVFIVSLCHLVYDKRVYSRTGTHARFSDITSMALPLALSAYIRSALLTLEHILIPKRLRDGGESLSDSLSQYGILHGMALPMLLYPMSPLSSFAGLLVPEFAEGMARGEEGRMRRIASEALGATLSYATVVSVFLSIFSEELGYVFYDSYSAGYYVSIMAVVVPIMYLDHVADSMLKGIGEHVYSMWVNISDSILSIVLVWFLIPALGISGYALVIVIMEAFNFILSAMRLHKRIRFKIDLFSSFFLPLASAAAAAIACRRLFTFSGADSTALSLVLKLTFSVCIFFAIYLPISNAIKSCKYKKTT